MATDFTALQKDAIAWRAKDVCVVAGPGSGKTTVLVERFFRLVEDHGFDLHQILAITFTEKAAANMKAKIAKAFEDNPAKQAEVDRAWISTIHGFCTRLLKENAVAAGIDPAFSVLDQYEAEDLQRECMSQALDALLSERREETLRMMAALAQADIAWHLIRTWDAIRSAGLEIAEVRAKPNPAPLVTVADLVRELRAALDWRPVSLVQREEHAALRGWLQRMEREKTPDAVYSHKPTLNRIPPGPRALIKALRDESITAYRESLLNAGIAPHRSMIFDIFERFIEIYTQRKEAIARLDFADLERHAIRLLRDKAGVCDRVRRRFRQIMLDEYQDINEQQQSLVDLIRGDDVFFGVGDVNQSIYGFRHAKPDIFRHYREQVRQAGKHLAPLDDNFRSRADILRCVEEVLSGAEGIEQRDLVSRGEFGSKNGPSIEVIRVLADEREEGSEREAGWIAHRILELRLEHGYAFGDFGIMCRTAEAMEPILRALESRNIPYVCGRRQSWLVSREGKDATALVALLASSKDEIALATVLRSPLAGVSDETLLTLRLAAKSLSGGLHAAIADPAKMAAVEPADARRLMDFAANLSRLRSEAGTVPLDLLLSRVLRNRSQDIEEFLRLARSKASGMTPLQFLRLIEQLRDARATSEIELSDEEQGNRVQVMTAHAAKGLEFGVAIVAAMNKGSRIENAPVNFTREHGLGLKWADGSNKGGVKDSWSRFNSDRIKEREKEEENRLLYVAMTRAKEHLVLSSSTTNTREAWSSKVNNCYNLRDRAAGISVDSFNGYNVRILTALESAPEERSPDALEAAGREAIYLAPPEPGDQSDSTVTVTSLTMFAHDPAKYFRERYLGWTGNMRRRRFDPEALPPDKEAASDIGSSVHEALAGKPGPFSAEVTAMAETFGRSELARRLAKSPRVEREWDFVKDINGMLVRGSIDLWFEENGEAVLVDYKTDDVPAAEAIERAGRYNSQLALYALALDRKTRAGYLHFLRPNVVVEVPLDTPALEEARDLVLKVREAQNARASTMGFE
jgi:ATP-dependent exoDNAse (exonuclease V) beta subunit